MSLTAPIHEWRGQEASGNALDDVGSSDLTAINGPTTAAGLLGNARKLVTGAHTVGQSFSAISGLIDSLAAWWLGMWIKPSTTSTGGNWYRPFFWGNADNSKFIFFAIVSGFYGRPEICIKLGGVEYRSPLPDVLIGATWYHLLITCSNGRIAVFLNGVCVSGVPGRDASGTNLQPTLLSFGDSGFNDNTFDGLFEYIQLGDYEPTPEQGSAIWNGGTPLAASAFASAVVPPSPTRNSAGRLPYILFSWDFVTAVRTLKILESAGGAWNAVYWTNIVGVTYTPTSGDCADTSGCLYGSIWLLAHTSGSSNDKMEIARATSATLLTWNSIGFAYASPGEIAWDPEWVVNADGTLYLDTPAGANGPVPHLMYAQTWPGSMVPNPLVPNAIFEVHPLTTDVTQWNNPANWSTPVRVTGTELPIDTAWIDVQVIYMGSGNWQMLVKKDSGSPGGIKFLKSSTSMVAGWDTGTLNPGSWYTGENLEGPNAFKIGSIFYIYFDRVSYGNGYATANSDFSVVNQYAGTSADILTHHGTVVFAPEPAVTVTAAGVCVDLSIARAIGAAKKIAAGRAVDLSIARAPGSIVVPMPGRALDLSVARGVGVISSAGTGIVKDLSIARAAAAKLSTATGRTVCLTIARGVPVGGATTEARAGYSVGLSVARAVGIEVVPYTWTRTLLGGQAMRARAAFRLEVFDDEDWEIYGTIRSLATLAGARLQFHGYDSTGAVAWDSDAVPPTATVAVTDAAARTYDATSPPKEAGIYRWFITITNPGQVTDAVWGYLTVTKRNAPISSALQDLLVGDYIR